MTESTETPIRTLAFLYAHTSNYKCIHCHKSILRKTLSIATLERKDKKQKKKTLEPINPIHFKCWTVPEDFTKKPLHVYRGYQALKDTDKTRMQRLYEAGKGASWSALEAADEEARQAEQDEADIAAFDQDKSRKQKKRKHNDEDNKDMTNALTGNQSSTNKKIKKKKETLQKKKKETSQKEVPTNPVAKLDEIHGKRFVDDFNKILEDFKQ
ncbi:uncharacterized protein BX664DRAFT_383984 [Halteromyces radiatus]|uniref:uncharacterized protein n=1 Tax=Halteromyces radiatus TaxID=101107 RepID=UPI00221F650E|nr:uncharacterized protein BX664DRAFT_383984 [Halteromyces radiatus]KAI8097747.1 hypothetical protein BX664DRAFT_383984 [Halteromyces radiatus]